MNKRMKRKLIQMAGKTMLVSLPSTWVKKYGLKKGEEIDIEEKGKNLIIRIEANKEKEGQEVTIYIPTEDLFMERSLHVWYRAGYDKINVTFDDKNVLRKIRLSVKKLLGFSMINETEKSCTIKSVATGLEEEFDNILRRVFLSLLTIAKESQENIESQNYKNLKDVLVAEENNNIQCWFCERILNKRGYKESEKTSSIYCTVWTLEQIADEYKGIANLFIDLNTKQKVNKKTLEIYSMTNKSLETIYNLFYKRTLKDLKQHKTEHEGLKKETLVYFSKAEFADKEVLHHLMTIQDKISQISFLIT